MSNRLSSRLARLLNLVPYFIANPGISPAEAAEELGVSTTQLMTDLNQLWVCGLPGYGPGDLIDLSFSEEVSRSRSRPGSIARCASPRRRRRRC